MRNLVPFVTIALLCLALAPCVPAQPSFTNPNLVKTRQDKAMPPRLGSPGFVKVLTSSATWWRPSVAVGRRSLKSTSKSKPKKSKYKKPKWRKEKATLWGSVLGVSIFVGTFALCAVYITVTEKREEDPNWRLRTFLRRRLKRKNKSGADAIDDMEKPAVEKVPQGDLDADPVKKVDPDAK